MHLKESITKLSEYEKKGYNTLFKQTFICEKEPEMDLSKTFIIASSCQMIKSVTV